MVQDLYDPAQMSLQLPRINTSSSADLKEPDIGFAPGWSSNHMSLISVVRLEGHPKVWPRGA